ncbi:hypothetical protein FACS189450_08480 [Spirochaetia bacterium]|nr:hypothetical protein FACS189450_08480 [Spirochaetia bacterium]
MRLAKEGQTLEKPQDMLKNPLVLEFLGLEEKGKYSCYIIIDLKTDELKHQDLGQMQMYVN